MYKRQIWHMPTTLKRVDRPRKESKSGGTANRFLLPDCPHDGAPVAEKINPSVNQVTCAVDDIAQLWRHTLNKRR